MRLVDLLPETKIKDLLIKNTEIYGQVFLELERGIEQTTNEILAYRKRKRS